MPDVKHFDPEQVLDQVVELFWRRGAASTGIADVVAETGLSRSSLYASFGGKRELHVAALRRYVQQRSQPVFDALADDDRGLPAIAEFFDRLIQARCEGHHARWGCMVSNAHAGLGLDATTAEDTEIAEVLGRHHAQLTAAMRSALETARSHGRLRPGLEPRPIAEMLALLAYGVNLRSRAGAPASDLKTTVTAALEALSIPTP